MSFFHKPYFVDTLNVILNVLLKHVLMKRNKKTTKTQKQNVILTKDLYMTQKVFISILYLSILIHILY